jgi:hypothetical protein
MAGDEVPSRHGRLSRWPQFPARSPRGARAVLTVLGGAGLAAYGWIAASAAPFSGRALVGVVIPGAVLGAIAYGRPPERIEPPHELDSLGMSAWVICLGLLFEWEASAFRDNSAPWHPSLTNLIDPLLGPHLVKTAAIVIWLMAGWGLVKR